MWSSVGSHDASGEWSALSSSWFTATSLGLQAKSLNCPRKGRRQFPASFLWQPWYAQSTALVGDATIYRIQLPDRGSAPAHRVRLSFPLLSSLRVRDAMIRAPIGDAGAMPGGTHAVLTLAPNE